MSKGSPYKIIAIHGWGGTKNSLADLGSELQTKLRQQGESVDLLELLELPGFGTTELNRVFSFEDYCEYVYQELLKANNGQAIFNENFTAIAHSFGGKILLKLASSGKLQNISLVIINSSGLKPRLGRKKQIFQILAMGYAPFKKGLNSIGLGNMQRLIRRAGYKYLVKARDYEKITQPELIETFKNVLLTNLSEAELAKISNKTLLLWAEQDKDTPLWMGEKLHRLIPQSTFVTVPEATHGLPLKQPEKCAQIIFDWLL